MSSARKRRRRSGPPALEIVEHAVFVLRRAPAALIPFYVGAVPFWMAVLVYFSDMTQSAFAWERVTSGALVVAAAFCWMKCWQCVYASQLRAAVVGAPRSRWTPRRVARMALRQCAWQPWGLIARPVSLALTVPYAWVSSFFQNVTVLEDGAAEDERTLVARATSQARLWPGQAHIIILVLTGFVLLVWLNIFVALLIVPSILKMFLGWETVFSRAGMSLLNTTLITATFALTHLCIEPFWKAVYVVRCFRGESLATGDDLLVELRQLGARYARGAALSAALLLAMIVPDTAHGQTPPVPTAVPAPELSRQIDDVLARREFAWRMPREKLPVDRDSSTARFAEDVRRFIVDAVNAAAEIWRDIRGWFRKVFGRDRDSKTRESGWSLASPEVLKPILYVLIAGCVIIAGILVLRRRRTERVIAAAAVEAVPDLRDESVSADQLPEEGWLQLAREMLAANDLRLALRALYLAALAHLGRQGLLTLAAHKSNLDYQRELRRRARARQQLLSAFGANLGVFERAWYGRHEVTRETLAEFERNLEAIRAC